MKAKIKSKTQVMSASKKPAKPSYDQLEMENHSLRVAVERLTDINAKQLSRLIQTELLKDRMQELEKQLADKKDQ